MKKPLSLLLFLAFCLSATAQPSSTYYKSIDGLKKEELKKALRLIISNHTTIKYNSLGSKYPDIYYLYDDEKGSESARVYDLFSDEVFSFTSTSMWNKEHVVPQSWWNDKSAAAYSDIFSVIPSLSTANSSKSNYPPGIVNKSSTKTKDSGRMWTGPATDGTGGSYSNVWEPYDDYKGDFARIIMYVATCYADLEWGSNTNVVSEFNKEEWPTMNEWLYKLMLKWHNDDPVSEKEKKINNDAYDSKMQKNRNPFIDYPVLADYIWGDYQNQAFDLSSATLYAHIGSGDASFFTVTYMANGGSAAPAAQTTQDSQVTITTAKPYRSGYVFTGWNTRSDGRGQSYTPGQTYTLSANITLYAQWAENGEHSETIWQLVTSNDDIAAGDCYVIAYSTANVVAGDLSKEYLQPVAATFSTDKTTIETLPEGALVFTLDGTSGAWTLTCDKGTLGTTAAKKVAFNSGTTTWDISVTDGVVTIASTNSSCGNLQYNEGSPRFNTYTSKQKPVQLYRQVASTRHFTVTTTDFNYATLYVDYAVTIPDGAEVFFATLTDDRTTALLHPICDVIPAQTAVIVRGEPTTPYTFEETSAPSTADVTGNLLVGFLTDTSISGTSAIRYYAVNYREDDGTVGFFAPKGAGTPNGSFTAVAHKAYLKISGDAASSLALRIDGETAISDCTESPADPEVWYDLCGRKVIKGNSSNDTLPKGIYIVNGRKVVVR